ncbi:MAG: CvpA family protein [Hydrogenothermaceae bacterium]|nr:CvpA family protein [Hydrogenothermaceae bacterium]
MDLFLFFVLLYLVFNGLYKGFSGLVLKSLGFVVGVYLSLPLYRFVSTQLSKIFSGSFFLMDFFSFFLIFLFVLSTFLVVERLLKGRLYKKRMIAIADRVLGGILGVLVFILLLVFLLRFENESPLAEKLLSSSKIVEMFRKI